MSSTREGAGAAPTTAGLAGLLARLREETGLSPAALAERLGLSRVTVREAELGRDPNWSTLESYFVGLDALLPPEVFPGTEGRVPPSAEWVLRAMERLQQVRLGSLRLRLGVPDENGRHPATLRIGNARAHDADLSDEDVRTHLMRAVFAGGSMTQIVAESRDLSSGRRRLELGDEAHEFSFPKSLRARGLSYRRDRRLHAGVEVPPRNAREAVAAGLHLASWLPADRLELVLPVPSDRVRAAAWPAAWLPSAGDELDLDDLHHSAWSLQATARGARLCVRRPMPGLSYALLPTGADAAAPRRVPRTVRQEPRDEPADSGADAVRRARQRGRLSRRELARRAGCSPTTIGRLEDGLDARWSTLARCIEMLPSLSPWSLLGLGEEQLSPDPARLWCFLRDLHGLEADEDFKTVAIAADGNSAIEIVTRNLRVLRSVPKELRLLLGLGVPVLQPTTAELQGVGHLSSASLEGQLRIAALTTADGARLHELRVPGIVAERGFSFGRRFRHAGIYALDSEQARARTGQEGPFHQGASLGSRFPVKRLRLRLRFPRGRRPPEVVPCAWSMAHAPDPGRDESLRALPARSVEVIEDRRRNAWELIAERPPVGVKFALAWFLD